MIVFLAGSEMSRDLTGLTMAGACDPHLAHTAPAGAQFLAGVFVFLQTAYERLVGLDSAGPIEGHSCGAPCAGGVRYAMSLVCVQLNRGNAADADGEFVDSL